MSRRNPGTLGIWGPNGTRVVAADAHWKQLARWDRWAAAGTCWSCGGKPTRVDDGDDECQTCGGTGSVGDPYVARVFCASLADVAEGPDTMPAGSWPAVQAARERLVATVEPLRNTVLLLLTKRPENLATYFPADFLARHWIGTSVENQAAADERIPHLLRTPAAVRFISAEPLLGPVDLFGWLHYGLRRGIDTDADGNPWCDGRTRPEIDWVIVGGESGPNARPMHPAWARSIRDQCLAAGVAFHFKQWGEFIPCDQGDCDTHRGPVVHVSRFGPIYGATEPMPVTNGDHSIDCTRVGKHVAGRELDGQTWDQFPNLTTTEAQP